MDTRYAGSQAVRSTQTNTQMSVADTIFGSQSSSLLTEILTISIIFRLITF